MICLFFITNCRFYSTLLPEAKKPYGSQGDSIKRFVVGKPHRNFTSPRISASRPHCLSLWLDGSSIITVHFIAKQSTTDCFMTGRSRSSPSMPSVRRMLLPIRRQSPRARQCRCRFLHGWTAHVFKLPDMIFSRSKRGNRKTPSLTSTLSEGVERKNFYFSKSFFNLARTFTFLS